MNIDNYRDLVFPKLLYFPISIANQIRLEMQALQP